MMQKKNTLTLILTIISTVCAVLTLLVRAITNSTLPKIRLHDLRHSTASNLLAQGFSIVQVQEWLGHGSPSTTLNIYSHIDKTSKTLLADRLGGILVF